MQSTGALRDSSDLGGPADLVKFTGLVAVLAIFVDAAVGHALLWENDPYWTYWITKTLLIATVFGLGSAWLGVGPWRGAAVTAVHTLILTVYYWTLSPIGLPSHPEWLDLEHTWVTGVPVHFGVIYLGYLLALWLWRRRRGMRQLLGSGEDTTVGRIALEATAVALILVIAAGGVVTVVLQEFPGVTWFVVRLLLTVPFVFAWWALAGRDRAAAVVGGLTLAFLWGTYSHFLGPIGLPDLPLRIAAEPPPAATVSWLSYRQEWLTSVPVFIVVFVVVLLLAARPSPHPRGTLRPVGVLAAATVVLAAALGVLAWFENPPRGDVAEVASSGPVEVEQGDWYSDRFVAATGELTLEAQNRNPRVTPLPPHDGVDLTATLRHPDGGGTQYEVRATQPMVDDPLGRHTTWWGVGLHVWHHGQSGVGSSALPAIRSEVAVFAVGEVRADGELVAAGVPVHVMTAEHEQLPGALELSVGDEQTPVPALPDGHLRAVWEDYTGGAPQGPKRARNMLGSGVLLGLLGLMALMIRQERAVS